MKGVLMIGCFQFLSYSVMKQLLENEVTIYGSQPKINMEKDILLKEFEIGRNAFFHPISGYDAIHEISGEIDLVFYESIGDSNDLQECLALCKDSKTRFIYLSTLEIFEGNTEETITEETAPVPLSKSNKLIIEEEKLVSDICQNEDIPFLIIRTSPLYGPWQCDNQLFQALIEGKEVVEQQAYLQDLLFVEDAAKGCIKASKSRSLKNEIIHLCSGNKDLEEGLSFLAEDYKSYHLNIETFTFSMKKARQSIKFKPKMDIKSGLEKQKEFLAYKRKLEELDLLNFD